MREAEVREAEECRSSAGAAVCLAHTHTHTSPPPPPQFSRLQVDLMRQEDELKGKESQEVKLFTS